MTPPDSSPPPGDTSRQTTPPETATPETIAPFPFEPSHHAPPPKAPRRRRLAGIAATVILLLLIAGVWFVFTARQLHLEIQPEPDRVDVRGGLIAPRLQGYYLLRPGTYRITAAKEGYADLATEVTVGDKDRQTVRLTMAKLPGRLDIVAHVAEQPEAAIPGARVLIDGQSVGETPVADLSVGAGDHPLRIEADLYRPLETTITVEGMDRRQTLAFGLTPDYAEVTIDSRPAAAEILIDGVPKATTPASLPVGAGPRRLELRRAGYKPWTRSIKVSAGVPITLDTAVLAPLDGRLNITSQPAGANVMIGTRFQGRTPLEIELPPDRVHVVQLSKSGYAPASREVTLASGETTSIRMQLAARTGVVYLKGAPQGAVLHVDGRLHGPVPEKISLLAVPHRIEIKARGYTPIKRRITPRPGFPIELEVTLKRTNATETPGVVKAPNGYRLKLIAPGRFEMGASRREQGRRANETLRIIRLTRPVYMGLKEVTNRQFREFAPGHDSGTFKGIDLDQDDRPAVQVTWEQAARFCNWLSRKEGLPPVYVEINGKLRSANPVGNGYRLPTEAEWEFCARYRTTGKSWKYPWGESYPPQAETVNIADASAASILTLVLDKYEDDHPAAAPVGSFPASPKGLYDLGGNVAEWCHDYYSIYPYRPGQVDTDPTGPQEGQHHVIKGGSWKHASIRNLRAAFRDYQDEPRVDLGFRVCRYAGPKKKMP